MNMTEQDRHINTEIQTYKQTRPNTLHSRIRH